MRRSLMIATLCASVAILGACTSEEEEAGTSSPSSPAPSVAEKPGPDVTTKCGPADESSSDLQLRKVTLSSSSGILRFTWKTNDVPDVSGQGVSYWAFVNEYGPDGNGPSYQVGVRFSEGKQVEYSIFSFGASTQENLTATLPAPDGKSFSADFPLSSMPGIEEPFQWGAALSVGGEDASYCPSSDAGLSDLNYPSPSSG